MGKTWKDGAKKRDGKNDWKAARRQKKIQRGEYINKRVERAKDFSKTA